MELHINFVKNENGKGFWQTKDGKALATDYAQGNVTLVTDISGSAKQTKARFLNYTNKVFRDSEGQLLEGDTYRDGIIMRFHNGKLDGQGEPAIETETGDIEYWSDGVLQEIVTDYMCWKEKWCNNVLIEVIEDKD